jgi:hypothetical protein
MTANYKLQVKLGVAEFNAEGPEETVKEQFQLFLAAAAAAPVTANNGSGSASTVGVSGSTGATVAIDSDLLSRFFQEDDEESVSLRVLPKTAEKRDADSLVLLLYGHRALKSQQDVVATRVLKAAKQSGLTIDRIEKVLGVHEALYSRGGIKKGTRYGLNNQGIAYAEDLIRKML